MFGYCCGHATIVALRQPLSSLFEAATGPTPRLVTTRVVLLPGDAQPEDDHSDDCAAALRGSVIRRTQAAAESRAVECRDSRRQTPRSLGGNHPDNRRLQRL